MVHLGHEATSVGCVLVVAGVDVDGTGVSGAEVGVGGSGMGVEAVDGVGARAISSRNVSLVSRITHSYDILVPPLSKIMSQDLRKCPEG